MSIVPKYMWGPINWRRIHIMAINYPDKPTHSQQVRAAQQIMEIINNLPCGECRHHAVDYVKYNPPNLINNIAFQLWAYNFHNSVNARLGKPIISFDDYNDEYAGELLCRMLYTRDY